MQLFYQPGIPEGIHHLDPEESRHCIKVLRKKLNDTIDIVDGKGTFYKALILAADPRQTLFEVVDQQEEIPKNCFIHLAVAPTKRLERMEWLVEKATELGVDRISLIQCQRGERAKIRLDRLQKKAISAMKQSLRATLPLLEGLIDFKRFLSLVPPETYKLLAHLNEDAIPLQQAMGSETSYCILIGPEGDFTTEEIQLAAAAGAHQVSLGSYRLRTETAALAAVVAIKLVS